MKERLKALTKESKKAKAEGLNEGIEKAKVNIARELLDAGIPDENIAVLLWSTTAKQRQLPPSNEYR